MERKRYEKYREEMTPEEKRANEIYRYFTKPIDDFRDRLLSDMSDRLDWTKVESQKAIEAKRNAILDQSVNMVAENPTIPKSFSEYFRTGNYVFHGINNSLNGYASQNAISIIESGYLTSAKGAGVDGHGGNAGISWNFNNIGVLPGNNGMMIGFIASVEAALTSSSYEGRKNKLEKFVVPDLAAQYEVQQVADDIKFDPKIKTSDMYFLCPKADALKWAEVFAHLGDNAPRGLIGYDQDKIYNHRWTEEIDEGSDDYKELSRDLRRIIPETEQTIEFGRLLGLDEPFDPNKHITEDGKKIGRDILMGRQTLKISKLFKQHIYEDPFFQNSQKQH